MNKYFLGIDPGWTNCGWCLVDQDGNRVTGGVIHPKNIGIAQAIHTLFNDNLLTYDIGGASVERYVYYDGIHNPHSEQILMITGAIQLALYQKKVPVQMYKAIEWKSRLNKYLFKNKDFRNPSDKLDKVFSLAAGECCTGHSFKTDHEADAACLATMARLLSE